jgi:hypothetical protein
MCIRVRRLAMQHNRRAFIAVITGAAVCAIADAGWREATFNICSYPSGNPKPVEGYTRDCFGVRKVYEAYRDILDEEMTEYWNITHIPTGLSIGLEAHSRAEAQQMADRVIAAGNWSAINGKDHPDMQRLRDVVLAIQPPEAYRVS